MPCADSSVVCDFKMLYREKRNLILKAILCECMMKYKSPQLSNLMCSVQTGPEW